MEQECQGFKLPNRGLIPHLHTLALVPLPGPCIRSLDTMSANMDALHDRVIEPLANYLDRPSLVILSRVSRRWNAGANRALWRHLRSFEPLLRLLRPQYVQGVWGFETPIDARTLARFDEIAACVHSFEWSETNWTQTLVDSEQWAHELRNTRLTHDLLPNLRWFRASCETLYGVRTVVPWISTSLSSVDITFSLAADDVTATYFLSTLEARSRHITSFSLRIDRSQSHRLFMGHVLLVVLRNLREVRRVNIPLPASSSQHLDTLGTAPHLEVLTLFLLESPSGDDTVAYSTLLEDTEVDAAVGGSLHALEGLRGLSSSLPLVDSPGTSSCDAGPFPSLRTLRVIGSLTDIAGVVQATTHNLERLHMAVPSIQSEHEMVPAMEAIATFCPHLAFITMEFFSEDRPEWVQLEPLNQRPLQIHIRHPQLRPNFLFWRIDRNGVVSTGLLPDHA